MFSGGIAHSISENASNLPDYEDKILPILIVGREYYQEYDKTYPISDESDVKNIIKHEFSGHIMYQITPDGIASSTAKVYEFDAQFGEFIDNKNAIFVPETLLTTFLEEGVLVSVSRLGSNLNLIQKGEKLHSTCGTGIYADEDMFLYSSGAGDAAMRVKLTQDQYVQQLLTQLFKLTSDKLMIIARGQVFHKKLLGALNIRTLLSGFVLGIILYIGGSWSYLSYQKQFGFSDIDRAKVKEVISLRQSLKEKHQLLGSLDTQSVSASGGEIWGIVTELLEQNISVSGLAFDGNELSISLLSESATDSLNFLRTIPHVIEATANGDIYSLQGKQAVNVLVILGEKDTNE